MDFTSRMVALLGELRRERNGAVADAMRCYGAPYGLNYGVSLPTLRKLARAETPDHDFARYLYLQEVRELRLAALHIARPESLTPDEFPAWAAGIVNSEVAEEAAFAFLSRSAALPALFDAWIADPNPLLRYAALHSAARSDLLTAAWIPPSNRSAAPPNPLLLDVLPNLPPGPASILFPYAPPNPSPSLPPLRFPHLRPHA